MAEPLPNEDQDPAPGFQYNGTGEELAARLHAGRTKTIAVFMASQYRTGPGVLPSPTLNNNAAHGVKSLDYEVSDLQLGLFSGVIPEGADLTAGLEVLFNWFHEDDELFEDSSIAWRAYFFCSGLELGSPIYGSVEALPYVSVVDTVPAFSASSAINSKLQITNVSLAVPGAFFTIGIARDPLSGDDIFGSSAKLASVELRTIS